ncbi:hypothetical protein DITRI_Ditri09bG0146100 [Diplodiscus trichospermus]
MFPILFLNLKPFGQSVSTTKILNKLMISSWFPFFSLFSWQPKSIIFYVTRMFLLIFDYGKYIVFNGILQLIIYTKEKNAILFTYPPAGSVTSTGLVVSSKLPRFSDLYTLTIASADPKSISAGKPVEFTKSVTQWFTKDGVLVEGLFWKDVEALADEYAAEPKKKK